MTISRNLSFLAEGVSSTGVLGVSNGGTGQSSITTGDLLYGSASNTISKLAIGSTGTILRVVGGVPTWGTDYTGTVTSVAASVPSFLSISGSPITTSGTLAITYSGTALPTANGGTALTSFTSNGVLYASSSSALSTGSGLQFDGTNLGINTTPNAWGSNYKVLQQPAGWFGSYTNVTIQMGQNFYDSGIAAYKYVNTAAASNYWQTAGQHAWFTAPSGTAGNTVTFTQAMTLTNSGNLGVGGTSPFAKISSYVSSSGTFQSAIGTTNSVDTDLTIRLKTGITDLYNSAGVLTFSTSSGENLRLDTSGNLGLGTAPSTWGVGSGGHAFELAGGNSIWSYSSSSGFNFSQNLYYNGAYIYKNTGAASLYGQGGGVHYWYIAPSGTGGNTFALTQAMTLFNSGGVSIGNTTDPGATNLSVTGNVTGYNISSYTQTKSVGIGATQNLFYVGSYGSQATGFMTIRSVISGGGLSVATYVINVMGNGLATGVVLLASETYGSGGASFTVLETRNSPAAPYNQVSMTNTSGSAVTVTISYQFISGYSNVTFI